MGGVDALDGEVDLGRAGPDRREQPLVGDLEQVGAGVADHLEDRGERAGTVVEGHPEPAELPGAHEAALDDRRQQPGVDVAAGEHDADPPAGEALAVAAMAAMPAAPAPSTTTFSISSRRLTASSMPPSVTVTTPAVSARMMRHR